MMKGKFSFGGNKFGVKKQNNDVENLISEELDAEKGDFISPSKYDQQRNNKVSTKPSFAMKPNGLKKPQFNAVPNQTPSKYYEDGGNMAGVQDLAESAAHQASPPIVQINNEEIAEQKVQYSNKTPPPVPGQSRVVGAKQFSKPMAIKKKKFQMAAPEPGQGGQFGTATKLNEIGVSPQRPTLGVPQQMGSAQMQRDLSKGSLMNRDGSANRLVEDTHLGPQIMKKKISQQVSYNAYQNGPNFGGSAQRPASKMKLNNGQPTPSSRGPDQQSEEDYDEGGFDDVNEDNGVDEMEKLRLAMAKEKAKAQKFNTNKTYNKVEKKPMGGPSSNPLALQKNLDGFAKQKGLVMGERVDHQAAGNQAVRAKELRDIIQLSEEEHFNIFEMVPQTPQDIYFNKLQGGSIKTAIISTIDDNVDQEMQTEDLGNLNKFNQAPDDILINYNRNKDTYQRRKKRQNEALNLEKFINAAGPVMEKVVEENQANFFERNKAQAAKRNAVELTQNIKFPAELLHLFSSKEDNQPAQIMKISCIHSFESCPQSKIAVAFNLMKANGDRVYVALIYEFSINNHQITAVLQCEQEITQMCTPGSADLIVLGTILGSLFLFDLKNIETNPNLQYNYNYTALLKQLIPKFDELDDNKKNQKLQRAMIKYSVQTHIFLTDGLENHPHFSPVKKLVFINRQASGIAQIGVLDEQGIVSTWNLIEMQSHLVTDYDVNMNLGGKFKMTMVYTDNLMSYPNVIGLDEFDDLTQSIEMEFDPEESQIFYFTTSEGLFKKDKREQSDKPQKMDTIGLNSPTALSMSDRGFLLAAYSCGSICLYQRKYTTPITVWYHNANGPITQIKWCQLYFDDQAEQGEETKMQINKSNSHNEARFASRICEFFTIDQCEDFKIWNLQRSTSKPAHVINFSQKHSSDPALRSLFRISNTCPDQSFFTIFALKDHSANIYLMNFKKGSSITKGKLTKENKNSLKIIKNLPSNNSSLAQRDLMIADYQSSKQE